MAKSSAAAPKSAAIVAGSGICSKVTERVLSFHANFARAFVRLTAAKSAFASPVLKSAREPAEMRSKV